MASDFSLGHRCLQQIASGVYAYVQPTKGWGWSNAGLIVDGDCSLLVDSLFDLRLATQMHAAMREATPAAELIDIVVNTHSDGDHWWGNKIFEGARIIATRQCGREMHNESPQALLADADNLGAAGRYLKWIFAPFHFDDVQLLFPTDVFDDYLELSVGDTAVHLLEMGPAHTRGDAVVHVPDRSVVFTGDLLFHGSHPVVWVGPVQNWIAACDRVIKLGVEVVVPGHGPITNLTAVRQMRDYFEMLVNETRQRYFAGMSAQDAVRDIILEPYLHWGESERLAANIVMLYHEFSGERSEVTNLELYDAMAGQYHFTSK
jgi:glyoxylase-like metal-dependent hydrolase (beta-lactamase superfamily II)